MQTRNCSSYRIKNEDGKRIYYPNVEQKNFEKIPGSAMGYWMSDKLRVSFKNSNLEKKQVPKRVWQQRIMHVFCEFGLR